MSLTTVILTEGFWTTIFPLDIDGDGDMEQLAGLASSDLPRVIRKLPSQ